MTMTTHPLGRLATRAKSASLPRLIMNLRAIFPVAAALALAGCEIGDVHITTGEEGTSSSTDDATTSTADDTSSSSTTTGAPETTTGDVGESTFYPETTEDGGSTTETAPTTCMPCEYDGACLPGESCWCPSAVQAGVCLPDKARPGESKCDPACTFTADGWECQLPGC